MRLRLLTELAARGTIAAVAEAVLLSPSAVSQQLAVLETETKTSLLERYGRRVRLTAAGRLLVAEAQEILGAIERAEARLETLRTQVGGTVRLGSLPSAAATLVPSVLSGLRERYPLLSVHVMEMETREALDGLRLAELDLALIDDSDGRADVPDPLIRRIALFDDPLVAVLPPGHPLEHEGPIRVDRLREEKWVTEEPGTTYSALVAGLCRRAGFEPAVVVQARSIDVLLAFIESGAGVSILPMLHHSGTRRRVVHIPLEPKISRRVIVAMRRASADHPAVRAVTDAFRPAGAATPMRSANPDRN